MDDRHRRGVTAGGILRLGGLGGGAIGTDLHAVVGGIASDGDGGGRASGWTTVTVVV